jgi:predicted ester cyclase
MKATTDQGEAAKALYRQVIDRVWHRGDIEFIEKAYSPHFVARVPRSGFQTLDDFREHVLETREGIPDANFYVKEQYVDGCHLVSRFQLTGTHTGNFLGIPPTGHPIDIEGVSIHRLAGGRFVESWTVWDVIGLCQEIGLVTELVDTHGQQ